MDDFALDGLDAQNEGQLVIKHPVTAEPTTWIWTFHGPDHPATVALANKVSREALEKSAAQRQARINGKKWTEERQTLDQIRKDNVDSIVARTASFTPVKFGGETIEFSADAARTLLLDRKKGWLLNQIMEYLADEANFIRVSAKT